MMMDKKLLVIDGNSILNRAFYGIRMLTTKDGKFVAVEVAKSVIGPHQHLWSIYASKADAILDMELTAI